jgi:phosphatidate cytidylyltransferase
MKRVLSAAAFLPVFWVIVKKLPPWVYSLLIAAAALVALWELDRLAAARGYRGHRFIGGALALLILASFARLPGFDLEYALALGLFVIPLATLRRGGDWGPALGDIASTYFAASFVGVLFGFLLRLRDIVERPSGPETGSDLVFLLFFIVWSGDVAAYYVGTYLGERPLAPRLSPRKTVEGAIGGIGGSLIAAFVARAWFMHRLTLTDCLVLGASLGGVGLIGDLVESMIKRGSGVKDSAALVPGHGGVLDRVDSLLYAAPVLYYYYLFAMRGA